MAGSTSKPLILPANGMDLANTLFCGQSFSWHSTESGAFAGVAGRREVLARQQEDFLFLQEPGRSTFPTAEDEAFWRHYFALDVDYPALLEAFCDDAALAACVACTPGMRVLRQPFFDTLLSFIISQNNHIPRITGIVRRLCEGFGERLPGGGYAFPTPERLAALTPEDLAPLRAGFRAKYLIDAAVKVASGRVQENDLRAAPNTEARNMLCRIHGVGPKVADCVLLYSLGRSDIVPMDVWMKRAMGQVFPGGMPSGAKGVEGIAQQFIFCWAREHLK